MNQPSAIVVKDLYKSFKLPHESHSGIKQAVVNMFNTKKGFETQKALQNISFEIKKGEFFGIVGRNGSGKSTLLKILAGIYAPDSGLVQVNGSLTPFIELGVGFNPELTGRENVFLNGALLGFSKTEMEKMYAEIVEFAELEKFMDQKLKNYSSGMQVRLAFSIAVRARSDILLLDEVLAVGDGAFQQKCYDYFEEIKRQKKTVIFVSHDMGAIRRFCSNAIYVKNSKLIAQGTAEEIADIYLLENIDNESETSSKDNKKVPSDYLIDVKIKAQQANDILLQINYKSKNKQKMYIGISIIKAGISIAEITTSPQKSLIGNGKISYLLDTRSFNAGVYHIAVALFKLTNRGLIAVGKKKAEFIIKGDDITKGAALKLKDTWKYE